MRKLVLVTAGILALAACGGSDPAPAPEAAAPVAEKTEAPAAEEPAAEAPAPAEAEPEASPEEAFAAKSEDEQKAELMELGKNVYETGGSGGIACQTCHQANGEGVPGAFPPLKGSKDSMGDCIQHAKYVVHGVSGEMEVQGVKYNGAMPPQGNLSNLEIAAVISYERNSWGNDYGFCMPATVALAR